MAGGRSDRNGARQPTRRAVGRHRFPLPRWASVYSAELFWQDVIAAAIVSAMLVPQSLAYAMLAGLPPEVGLYASILPLVAYALLGSSTSLAVGPVAVVSLMTASAVSQVAVENSVAYASAAAMLALLSGAMLMLMGVFRLGFIANFLSYSVVSGFITASGIIIAFGQIGPVIGISTQGHTIPKMVVSLWSNAGGVQLPTLSVGIMSLFVLAWVRTGMRRRLAAWGWPERPALIATRVTPALVIGFAITLSATLGLGDRGVALVGDIPQGLPIPAIPALEAQMLLGLIGPALIISIVGFVGSISVAQTLAARKRERVDPDRELLGLGAANIAAGLTSAYPVTGGLARSAVNHDAGAASPAAGMLTAVGIAISTLLLTPFLALLPRATLATTIIIAVLSLVDFSVLRKSLRYSRPDFLAFAVTLAVTLVAGMEKVIACGVGLSVLLFLYRTSRPHVAIVGRVPGTEHFRNVLRHEVETRPEIISMRVDESLYFANGRYLEDMAYAAIAARPEARHFILLCSAINSVDLSALNSLQSINSHLARLGMKLHLSEVKGPVMDQLKRSEFLDILSGGIYLSHQGAVHALTTISQVESHGADRGEIPINGASPLH